MASDQTFVDYVCEQASAAGSVSARKMFGEYALYCGDAMVGLICDNQLFVKPTPGGKAMIGTLDEASPYPGAKPQYRIGEKIEDRRWMAELIAITARELPAPKPKKARTPPSK